jgi:hypothetical protein
MPKCGTGTWSLFPIGTDDPEKFVLIAAISFTVRLRAPERRVVRRWKSEIVLVTSHE